MRVAIAILAAALAGCGEKAATLEDLNSAEVVFPNGTKILAEQARDEIHQARGLSGRDSIAADRGMLFIFATPEKRPFWTFQARFPVDIVWIGKDHRIVEMAGDAAPCAAQAAPDCPQYGGHEDARFVLELKAGVAAKNGLRVGDRLDF